MQATELRYNHTYCTSDTYSTAYRHAREALGAQAVSNSTLARMDLLSRELAAELRDSSESLRDVRKICRQAVINAIRVHIGAEIDRVISDLDEIRMREVNSTTLDRATCSAFGARENLDSAPFPETLRNLETARTILNNLANASLSGEHFARTNRNPAGIALSFDVPSAAGDRSDQQPFG